MKKVEIKKRKKAISECMEQYNLKNNIHINTVAIRDLMVSKSAITLIGLLITIIVLLILSGVSLSLISGSDGIISKAESAVIKTNETAIKEDVELLMLEWWNDYYLEQEKMNGKTGTTGLGGSVYYKDGELTYITKDDEMYKMKVDEKGLVSNIIAIETDTTNQFYNSIHPDKHIPTGFEHTIGEWDTGYVIEDEEGNEFVWIPVESSEAYVKRLGRYNLALNTSNGIESAVVGDTLEVNSILGKNVTSTLDSNQPEKDVVNKAGGFWVGRYETGTERTETIETISWSSENVVVKKNVQPVRKINQRESVLLANKWKTGLADEKKGTVAFQSGLITGTQWDVMCDFIGWSICNSDCSNWGNYNNIESNLYTGYHSSDEWLDWIFETNVTKLGDETNNWVFPTGTFINKNGGNTMKKNIYDIAGNVMEWTAERGSWSQGGVLRGGWCAGNGSWGNATYRDGNQGINVVQRIARFPNSSLCRIN